MSSTEPDIIDPLSKSLIDEQYVVIDGALEPSLLDVISSSEVTAYSLFSGPLEPDMLAVSPHLILLNELFSQWLLTRKSAWGFYFSSSSPVKSLRHHLRQSLQVKVDDEEPILCRFYDPRILWTLIDVLSEHEKSCFIGPMSRLETTVKGCQRHDDVKTHQARYHKAI